MLAMVPRAFPDVRLIVHIPGYPVVDHTPQRSRVVRILNVPGHFMSLRPRADAGAGALDVRCSHLANFPLQHYLQPRLAHRPSDLNHQIRWFKLSTQVRKFCLIV